MLFRKTYEDNATGKLSDERYEQFSGAYEREQTDLKVKTAELQTELDIFNAENEKTDKFIELVEQYTDFTTLTTPMLNEFVDKVFVYNPDKSSGERVQKLDIYLSFIGKVEIPTAELTPEEMESEEQRLAKKRRQQEYFRKRYAEKKKQSKVD